MKEKKIAMVTPYLHENFLILALDSKWIEVFGSSIPTFTVLIDGKGRLVFVGPTTNQKNGEIKH